jgi:hypothetical protein
MRVALAWVILASGALVASAGACAGFKNDGASGDASDAAVGDGAAEAAVGEGGVDAAVDHRPAGQDAGGGDGGADPDAADPDGAGDDGSSESGAESGADSGAADGGGDAGPTGLDPGVVLPDPSDPPCDDPGNPSVCGGVSACRMATPDGGRCDNCNPQGTCSHLVKQPCSQSLDCDIDLQCFRGQCTLFCTLDAGTECGQPGACVDVGSVQKGLCDPALF